jgi:hypothetical protein
MKKILVLIMAIISLNTYSQTLPNGNLEDWDNFFFYDEPTDWHTPNPYTSLLGTFTVTKTEDAYSGSYSARLETSDVMEITIPGIITLADFSINLFDSSYSVSGGYFLQENVFKMTGWYKYEGIDEDSANILIYNFKNTEETGFDTIGVGVVSLGNTDTWLPFTVFMNNFSNAVPDTFNVLISSSGVAGAKAGSVLFVDSLNIYTNTGIIDLWGSKPKLNVYPNPAVSLVNFESETIQGGRILTIFDNRGRTMTEKVFGERSLSIDVNNYPSGIYTYTLSSTNKIVNSGSFIKN